MFYFFVVSLPSLCRITNRSNDDSSYIIGEEQRIVLNRFEGLQLQQALKTTPAVGLHKSITNIINNITTQ